uniref:Uncharacterized protein n=1 Tax=Ditylenchus dipsaci TaxID=166011 RepID=A0A915CTQ7_9BILA
MSAALLANSSYGNANFNLMNGNFMWPGPSYNQQMQMNSNNSQVKKSSPKKPKNSAEMGQMPSQELNFMLQQQQKQLVNQMFGQSGMANSQLQMAAQQNASNAFFAKAAVLQKSVVTSPNNQLKLPTISASAAGVAASNNGLQLLCLVLDSRIRG